MKKPREFWIEIGNDPSDDRELYKRYTSAGPFKPVYKNAEVVHLREVSPDYDKKIKKLIKILKELADVGIPKAKKVIRTWEKVK